MNQLTPLAAAREQTLLAWRRTSMRWVVVAVIAARIFTDTIGAAVIAVAFVTIAVAAAVNFAAARDSLPDAVRGPALRLGTAVVGTVALGVASLVWVLAQ